MAGLKGHKRAPSDPCVTFQIRRHTPWCGPGRGGRGCRCGRAWAAGRGGGGGRRRRRGGGDGVVAPRRAHVAADPGADAAAARRRVSRPHDGGGLQLRSAQQLPALVWPDVALHGRAASGVRVPPLSTRVHAPNSPKTPEPQLEIDLLLHVQPVFWTLQSAMIRLSLEGYSAIKSVSKDILIFKENPPCCWIYQWWKRVCQLVTAWNQKQRALQVCFPDFVSKRHKFDNHVWKAETFWVSCLCQFQVFCLILARVCGCGWEAVEAETWLQYYSDDKTFVLVFSQCFPMVLRVCGQNDLGLVSFFVSRCFHCVYVEENTHHRNTSTARVMNWGFCCSKIGTRTGVALSLQSWKNVIIPPDKTSTISRVKVVIPEPRQSSDRANDREIVTVCLMLFHISDQFPHLSSVCMGAIHLNCLLLNSEHVCVFVFVYRFENWF